MEDKLLAGTIFPAWGWSWNNSQKKKYLGLQFDSLFSVVAKYGNKENYISSFNKLLLQKEELEQKHLHLLQAINITHGWNNHVSINNPQVVESEKTAKWQYTRHCEDLSVEIKKLREEVKITKKYNNKNYWSMNNEMLHLAVYAKEGVEIAAPATISGIQQVLCL